jgi:diacylglycerol kinase family enzyme
MPTHPDRTPGPRQRAAAFASIGLGAVFLVLTVLSVKDDVRRATVTLPLIIVALATAWYALTRSGTKKKVAVVVCLVAVVGIVALGVFDGLRSTSFLVARIVAIVLAAVLGRVALGRDTRTLKGSPTPGVSVEPAQRGVLLVNPRSGNGTADKVGLLDACRQRGITTVVLGPDDDLEQLTRHALDDGADVIGMAGGDGSQALVASLAAERGVAMVVVPSGTRNHLAMDLGLDREDVIGALDAFGRAVERPLSLADVNGRVFVNNASLGLYARIVASPEYRDAKVDTTMSTVQDVLAPGTPAFDLRYTDGRGDRHDRAHLIQVSNGPYGDVADAVTSRPRLDTKLLGIMTLEIDDDRAAATFIGALVAKQPERFDGFRSWNGDRFEVDSGGAVDIGLDGEALTMEPPLRFSIRQRPVRVRLPRDAIGYSPAARAIDVPMGIRGVFTIAAGGSVPMRTAEDR